MVRLYVEGGGRHNQRLRTDARLAFSKFLKRAGFEGAMPTVVLCGSRTATLVQFCNALCLGKPAMLLVDSEAPVPGKYQSPKTAPCQWKPWAHLRDRVGDGWEQPGGTVDLDCHLMVQVMESWFLADRETVQDYFGKGFKPAVLPKAHMNIERVDARVVIQSLNQAARDTKKKAYCKGSHAFQILALLDPRKVEAASPWAKRFLDALRARCAVLPEGMHR